MNYIYDSDQEVTRTAGESDIGHERQISRSGSEESDCPTANASDVDPGNLVMENVINPALLPQREMEEEAHSAELLNAQHQLQDRLSTIGTSQEQADAATEEFYSQVHAPQLPHPTMHRVTGHDYFKDTTVASESEFFQQFEEFFKGGAALPSTEEFSTSEANTMAALDGFCGYSLNNNLYQHIVSGPGGRSFYAIRCHICKAVGPRKGNRAYFTGLSGLHRHYAGSHEQDYAGWRQTWQVCDKIPVSATDVEKVRGGMELLDVPGL